MDALIAKVFMAGNSQAVRLPKGLRFKGKTVQLVKTGSNITLVDPVAAARRRRVARELWGSCPQFPAVR